MGFDLPIIHILLKDAVIKQTFLYSTNWKNSETQWDQFAFDFLEEANLSFKPVTVARFTAIPSTFSL